jgi:hypothetical protein
MKEKEIQIKKKKRYKLVRVKNNKNMGRGVYL